MTTEPAERVQFSDAHIDFGTWKRTPDCCTAAGSKIAIASGGTHSSRCGSKVYESGGNAVDTAVAVALCLSVERIYSAGLGGGGFMLLHLKNGRTGEKDVFVDFRETAPKSATRDMYLDASGNAIAGLSHDGALSVAVPGMIAGLFDVQKKYGKLKWTQVVQPSIVLAKEGFAIYPSLAERITTNKAMVTKDADLNALLYPKGEPLKQGEILKQPALAASLEAIAKQGKNAFYGSNSKIAKSIEQVLKTQAAALGKTAGYVTCADLDWYSKNGVKWRRPLEGKFGKFKVVSSPPPSAGGVVLLETLNIFSNFKVDSSIAQSTYYHLLAESMRRGFADRAKWIGDPDVWKDRTYLGLISPEYGNMLAKQISLDRMTPAAQIVPGEKLKRESQNTTHLSVVDWEGNAISSTITINSNFGSGVSAPGTGIVLNNEMDDFSVKPGVKNAQELTGDEANSIAPHKRPVSSMMPTHVFVDEAPVLAVGSAGGSRIISSVVNITTNYLLIYPGDLRRSLFAPRVHHQWTPDLLRGEWKGVPEATQEKLKGMGYVLDDTNITALAQGVSYDPVSRRLTSVFDPRDEGGADAR